MTYSQVFVSFCTRKIWRGFIILILSKHAVTAQECVFSAPKVLALEFHGVISFFFALLDRRWSFQLRNLVVSFSSGFICVEYVGENLYWTTTLRRAGVRSSVLDYSKAEASLRVKWRLVRWIISLSLFL
jgi:hypothetical protein